MGGQSCDQSYHVFNKVVDSTNFKSLISSSSPSSPFNFLIQNCNKRANFSSFEESKARGLYFRSVRFHRAIECRNAIECCQCGDLGDKVKNGWIWLKKQGFFDYPKL